MTLFVSVTTKITAHQRYKALATKITITKPILKFLLYIKIKISTVHYV